MTSKRIFMAGVGGMLGAAFHEVFAGSNDLLCTDKDVNAPWLSPLDFRDWDEYRRQVAEFKPDLLFHIGAHTSLEYCEDNQDDAYQTNTLAVEEAVRIANNHDIPLLYISTAGIFDGAQEHYDDWDTPNPLGHYARSKYMGELAVMTRCRRPLVCRAGWMMGGGPEKDKKFVQKLMSQIRGGQDELKIVTDKMGTPTYTRDFARNVQRLVDREAWGLYNLICSGVTDRFEVATELVSLLELTERVRVTPVDSAYFASTYFAPRPPSERLVPRKLELSGLYTMRDWRVCLKEYLDQDYRGYLD